MNKPPIKPTDEEVVRALDKIIRQEDPPGPLSWTTQKLWLIESLAVIRELTRKTKVLEERADRYAEMLSKERAWNVDKSTAIERAIAILKS